MSSAKLIWVTPEAEYMMAYIARGSNPPNQENTEYEKLFRYMLKHQHFSPFQMASMCVQVETSLAVATQIKRHWSISCCEPSDIQETSMRYMDPFDHEWGFQPIEFRYAAEKNRQSSEKPLTDYEATLAETAVKDIYDRIEKLSKWLKELGVANETIRMIYPQSTTTRFFLSGSCRSWIHYFEQRLSEHAQLEHQELGLQLWDIFGEVFPTVANIILLKGNSSVVAQTKHVNKIFKREEN